MCGAFEGGLMAGGAGPQCFWLGWDGTYTSGFKQTPVQPLWDSVGTLSLFRETLGIYII